MSRRKHLRVSESGKRKIERLVAHGWRPKKRWLRRIDHLAVEPVLGGEPGGL